MNDHAFAPKRSFADVWRNAAANVGPDGETLGVFASRLEGRAYGALALILGIVLLLPVRWVLPQIIGLLLLSSGWLLFSGSHAPALPVLGGHAMPKARLNAVGNFVGRQSWLNAIAPPRLESFAFVRSALSVALILAGVAALAPSTHFLLGLGVICLGLGVLQRDGVASLAGLAATLASAAFTLTLVAGAAAGAPFAAAWKNENLPFISAPAPPTS